MNEYFNNHHFNNCLILQDLIITFYLLEQSNWPNRMKPSSNHKVNAEMSQKQPFRISLTLKQVVFLSKLLPLNYSLQPQKGKRGRKSSKHSSKDKKRSNLSISNKSKELLFLQQDSNTQLMANHSLKPQLPFDKQMPIPSLEDENLSQFSQQEQIKDKKQNQKANQWMSQFIKKCDSVPMLRTTFGATLALLKQKIQDKNIQETDFNKTVINMMNNQTIKNTKKGIQLALKIKKIYSRYKHISNIEQKHQIKLQTQRKEDQISSNKSSSNKKINKKVETTNKRKSSQSSSDLGFDMNIIDFSKIKVKQQAIQYDMFFMNAAFISRNLRKIPQNQALKLLSKFGVNAIDLLKIKALSKVKLQELSGQVKQLKNKYPGKISDSQDDKNQYVQSSFQIEDD